MIRCPRCGQRLLEPAARCAAHGPAAIPQPEVAPRAPSQPPPTEALAALGYRLERVLGRGGFGAVYQAERMLDGRRVAIKLAARAQHDACESLMRERELLCAVGAPHVPEVHAAGATDGLCYLVMEQIALPSLAERLVALAGPAPLAVFEPLAHALIDPLEAIHACGIAHRDLKPENIFVPDAGPARIIDFGLAQQRTAAGEPPLATEDMGTAEYMSPEQCEGVVDADPRSDVYSLGILFYELLCGAPPFWGQASDVREAHRSKRPVPLSLKIACPPELDQVVRRCLAKERSARPADLGELRSALRQALAVRSPSRAPQPSGASVQPAAPPTAAREKRNMGLVFFESRAGVAAVQGVVVGAGGQIVQTSGAQYVVAFGHEAGDNPARSALLAAQRLIAGKLTQRALVDVAAVSVQQRPDGTRRIWSAVLTRSDRFPAATDPAGVQLSAAAADVLPDLDPRPLPDRPQRFVLPLAHSANEQTTLGIESAPLLGRAAELAQLLASAARAAREACPTLVSVLGAAGYGRTHLAGVLTRELERSPHGFELIRLTAQEGVVSASQVLPQLLRRLLDLPLTASPEQARSLITAQIGELGEGAWVAAAHVLGWLSGEHPELRRLLAAPGALRHASARVAGEALRRRAKQRPLALILDDAQLSDDAALDALEYASLPDAPARMWLCVLARPSFLGARPSWGTRAGSSEQITLGPLAVADACELASRLLLPAEYIPQSVLRSLVERTQGVPRLLVELTRGLKRDGFVRKSERGSGHYLAVDELDKLPDLPIVQWNAIREIEALPPQLAGHARLASVLGNHFTVPELEALQSVLERDPLPDEAQLDAGVGVQRLVDGGLLLRHRAGRLSFRHALLRDTIYQLLPEPQRARLHRAAFEAYCSLELPAELRLPRLAQHAARCGERAVAADTYLSLARGYARVQTYLEAEAAYSHALDNLDASDARSIEAARGRGLMRSRLGRQEGALADLRQARERAHAAGDLQQELELMLDEATVLDWTREGNQSRALAEQVSAAQATLSPLLAARLAMSLARSHHRRGEVEASLRLGQQAVQLAAALGDQGYESRIIALLMLATDYANSGRLLEAERAFEQVIAEAASRGDIWHVAAAHCNRAALWHGLRDVTQLRSDLARTVQLSREIGEASLEWVATYNLAESQYVLGQLAEARERAQRAFALSKQLFGEGNREVSVCELLLARIALYEDDLSAARRHVQAIRERARRALADGEKDAELEPGNATMLQMLELATRGAGVAAWQALLSSTRSFQLQPMEEVELLERASLCALQAGEYEAGRTLFERAREISAQKPNLISQRVEARLGPLFAPVA